MLGGKTLRRIKDKRNKYFNFNAVFTFLFLEFYIILHFRQTEHVQFVVETQPTIFKRFLNKVNQEEKFYLTKKLWQTPSCPLLCQPEHQNILSRVACLLSLSVLHAWFEVSMSGLKILTFLLLHG